MISIDQSLDWCHRSSMEIGHSGNMDLRTLISSGQSFDYHHGCSRGIGLSRNGELRNVMSRDQSNDYCCVSSKGVGHSYSEELKSSCENLSCFSKFFWKHSIDLPMFCHRV